MSGPSYYTNGGFDNFWSTNRLYFQSLMYRRRKYKARKQAMKTYGWLIGLFNQQNLFYDGQYVFQLGTIPDRPYIKTHPVEFKVKDYPTDEDVEEFIVKLKLGAFNGISR